MNTFHLVPDQTLPTNSVQPQAQPAHFNPTSKGVTKFMKSKVKSGIKSKIDEHLSSGTPDQTLPTNSEQGAQPQAQPAHFNPTSKGVMKMMESKVKSEITSKIDEQLSSSTPDQTLPTNSEQGTQPQAQPALVNPTSKGVTKFMKSKVKSGIKSKIDEHLSSGTPDQLLPTNSEQGAQPQAQPALVNPTSKGVTKFMKSKVKSGIKSKIDEHLSSGTPDQPLPTNSEQGAQPQAQPALVNPTSKGVTKFMKSKVKSGIKSKIDEHLLSGTPDQTLPTNSEQGAQPQAQPALVNPTSKGVMKMMESKVKTETKSKIDEHLSSGTPDQTLPTNSEQGAQPQAQPALVNPTSKGVMKMMESKVKTEIKSKIDEHLSSGTTDQTLPTNSEQGAQPQAQPALVSPTSKDVTKMMTSQLKSGIKHKIDDHLKKASSTTPDQLLPTNNKQFTQPQVSNDVTEKVESQLKNTEILHEIDHVNDLHKITKSAVPDKIPSAVYNKPVGHSQHKLDHAATASYDDHLFPTKLPDSHDDSDSSSFDKLHHSSSDPLANQSLLDRSANQSVLNHSTNATWYESMPPLQLNDGHDTFGLELGMLSDMAANSSEATNDVVLSGGHKDWGAKKHIDKQPAPSVIDTELEETKINLNFDEIIAGLNAMTPLDIIPSTTSNTTPSVSTVPTKSPMKRDDSILSESLMAQSEQEPDEELENLLSQLTEFVENPF